MRSHGWNEMWSGRRCSLRPYPSILHEAQIEGREEEQRQQKGGDLRFVLEPPIGDFVQHSILQRTERCAFWKEIEHRFSHPR